VLYKQTMQRSLREIPHLAQCMDGNGLLKSFMKMIEYTGELSGLTADGSRNCHCIPGKLAGSLSRDGHKKVESCMETCLGNLG
jgi:hypothetical protein